MFKRHLKLALFGTILTIQFQYAQAFISGEAIFWGGFASGLFTGAVGALTLQKSLQWAKNEQGAKKYVGYTVLGGSALGLAYLAGKLSTK